MTDPVAAPIVASLVERLQHLVDIGLDYLSLDRETDTLSGGESQRVKMVKHLGSSLVDVMYILDEPSIGLHPRDVHRLNELLQKLRDKGNTVHRGRARPGRHARSPTTSSTWARAPATRGGEIVFEGIVRRPAARRHADRPLPGPHRCRSRSASARRAGWLPIRNARANNLQGRRRRHPDRRADRHHRRGRFGQELADRRGVPAASTPTRSSSTSRRSARRSRSNPATYTGRHGRHPQGVRGGQQGRRRPVQLQLQGRLRELQGLRRHLHRPGVPRRRQDAVRGLRGPTVQGRGAGVHSSTAGTSARSWR